MMADRSIDESAETKNITYCCKNADENETVVLEIPLVKKKRYNQPRNAELTCQCDLPGGTGTRPWEEFPGLKEVLPDSYNYKVCKWSQVAPLQFCTLLRLPLTQFDQLQDWLDKFLDKTKTTFRKKRTYRDEGVVNLFKVDMCCQHASRGKSARLRPSKKNTDCQATLTLLLKKVVKGSRSSDPHLKTLPTIIKLNWEHNHPTNTAGALKFRDVSEETDEELKDLLRKGNTVIGVLSLYKTRLKERWGDEYQFICEDRRYLPDYGYVHRLKKSIENTEGIILPFKKEQESHKCDEHQKEKAINKHSKTDLRLTVKTENNEQIFSSSDSLEAIEPLQTKSNNIPPQTHITLSDIESGNQFLDKKNRQLIQTEPQFNFSQPLHTGQLSQEKNRCQILDNTILKSLRAKITHALESNNTCQAVQGGTTSPKTRIVNHSSYNHNVNPPFETMTNTNETQSLQTNMSAQTSNPDQSLQIDNTKQPLQIRHFNHSFQCNNNQDGLSHTNQTRQQNMNHHLDTNLGAGKERTETTSQFFATGTNYPASSNASISSDQSVEEIFESSRTEESSDDVFCELSKSIDELDELYEKMRNSLSERLALNPDLLEPAIKAFIDSGTQLLTKDNTSLCEALKNFGRKTYPSN